MSGQGLGRTVQFRGDVLVCRDTPPLSQLALSQLALSQLALSQFAPSQAALSQTSLSKSPALRSTGAVYQETILVIPILLLLLMGAIEFLHFLRCYNLLSTIARQAVSVVPLYPTTGCPTGVSSCEQNKIRLASNQWDTYLGPCVKNNFLGAPIEPWECGHQASHWRATRLFESARETNDSGFLRLSDPTTGLSRLHWRSRVQLPVAAGDPRLFTFFINAPYTSIYGFWEFTVEVDASTAY